MKEIDWAKYRDERNHDGLSDVGQSDHADCKEMTPDAVVPGNEKAVKPSAYTQGSSNADLAIQTLVRKGIDDMRNLAYRPDLRNPELLFIASASAAITESILTTLLRDTGEENGGPLARPVQVLEALSAVDSGTRGAISPSEGANSRAAEDAANQPEVPCDCWSEIQEFNMPIAKFFNWLGGLATVTKDGVAIHGANFGAMLLNFITEQREFGIQETLPKEPQYWLFPIQSRGATPRGIAE